MELLPSALVDKDLEQLIDKEIISSVDLRDGYLQPASIDLPIGDTAYLVDEAFLPFKHDVTKLIKHKGLREYSLAQKAELHKSCTYLIPTVKLNLQEHHKAKVSPKSSIGRIDLLVETISDHVGQFDNFPQGHKGQLWLAVEPQSFNVDTQALQAYNQLRIFDMNRLAMCRVDPHEILGETYDSHSNQQTSPNVLTLSLDVPKGFVGYRAKKTNRFLDLQKRDHKRSDFFEEVNSKDGKVTLEKDAFYILATRERVRIPPHLSAEMDALDLSLGPLRAHYAGFFDPGFGWPKGNKGVLEIRPQKTITVDHGQPICNLRFSLNTQPPSAHYGEIQSNYKDQRELLLAKFLK